MKTRENYIYIGLSIFALALFSLMTYIKGGSFDFDETFSLAMIDHSFSEMWAITARDYHPPLSYFILKVLSWLVEPLSGGNLLAYRFTGILGYYSIILLSIFPIRRLWGFRLSVITILFFILMPVSFYIYSNLRMYAWTAPLVLATFIYAYDAFQSNKKWAWGKLILAACGAMYIHYYSLISTFVTLVILLLVILISNKGNIKEQLKNYFICGIILVALYIPWLYFFVGQLAEVKSDYWIENPAMSDIFFAIQYYFVPKYYTEKYIDLMSNMWVLAIIPILLLTTVSIISLAAVKFKSSVIRDSANIRIGLAAFIILLVSLVMVMVYTFTVSPVYHIRYLMCYFGLFVLGFSFCIDSLLARKLLIGRVLVVFFAILLIADFLLCIHFNIIRSGFSFSNSENSITASEDDTLAESYYAEEDSFSDLGYLSVLYPNNRYFLITDDNPITRKATPPYIENDTISGKPFSNFSKVKDVTENGIFYYMSKRNPQHDSAFSAKYHVVDTVYSGLYRVKPIGR